MARTWSQKKESSVSMMAVAGTQKAGGTESMLLARRTREMGVGRHAGRIFCLHGSERETISSTVHTKSEGSEAGLGVWRDASRCRGLTAAGPASGKSQYRTKK